MSNWVTDPGQGYGSGTVGGSSDPFAGMSGLSGVLFGGAGGYDGTQFELNGLYSSTQPIHKPGDTYRTLPPGDFDAQGNYHLKNGTVIHAGDEYVKWLNGLPPQNYVDTVTGQQPNTINANGQNTANESTTNAGWGPVGNAASKFIAGYNPVTGGVNPLVGAGYLPVVGQIASLANMALWALGKQPSIDPKTGQWTWGTPPKTNPDGSPIQGVGQLPTFGNTGTNYLNADFGSGSVAPGDIAANPGITGGDDSGGGGTINPAPGTGTGTGFGSSPISTMVNGVPINVDPSTLANIAATAGAAGNTSAGTGSGAGSATGDPGPTTTGTTTTPPATATQSPPFPPIQPYQAPPYLKADPNSPQYQALAAMLSNRSTSPLIANPFGRDNPTYLSQTALGAGAPALGAGSLALMGNRKPDETGGAPQAPMARMADGGAVGMGAGMPPDQPQGPVPGWGGSMPWNYPGAGPRPQAQPASPMGAPPGGMAPQPPRPMPQPAQAPGAMPQMMGQPPNSMPQPMAMPQQSPMGAPPPQGFAKGGLVQAAEATRSAGRYGDDVLVHIRPDEFHQFEAMHGPHSVNPHTGLPEFGWFGDLLKTLAPVAALAVPGLGETVGNTLGVGSDIGSALTGAALGAVANGGKGALYGGLTGLGGSLLGNGTGSDFLQSLGLGPQTSGALINAAIGAGGAAAAGGNPLQGAAINGALSYFAPQTTGKIENAFAPKNTSLPTDTQGLTTTQLSDTTSTGGGSTGTAGGGALPAATKSAASSGGLGGLLGGKTDIGTILPLLLLASAASSKPKVITTPNMTTQPGFNNGQWLAGPYTGGLVPYNDAWANPTTKARGGPIHGGALMRMSPAAEMGAIRGAGDGKSDDVPAMLATGEHVIPAQDVSLMGNGDNDAGHARLEEMKQQVRRDGGQANAKHPTPKQKKTPAQMMKKKVRK